MITRGSLWLPLAILLLLAALSFWIERAVQIPPDSGASSRTDPEGIMENFDALRTDTAGKIHYRLTARRLKHYSGSKLTELELPRFVQFDPATGEVTATARWAVVSSDGSEVNLKENVTIERAARPGQSPMSLHTSQLIVFPERDLLRAPGPVEIKDSTLVLRAGAMQYDVRRRVIHFTGRVHARYLPNKG